MALNEDDKIFISMSIQSVNAKAEFRSDIIEEKLDAINSHLKTLNGRVGKTEDTVNQSIKDRLVHDEKVKSEIERLDKSIESTGKVHILNCPQNPELRKHEERIINIEKNLFGKDQVRKFLIQSVTLTSIVVSIIFAIGKIFFGI